MYGITKALILTDRINHANHLCGLLADKLPVLLTGELTKKDRAAAMEKVRSGAHLTIATTHLLGEGVDVNLPGPQGTPPLHWAADREEL